MATEAVDKMDPDSTRINEEHWTEFFGGSSVKVEDRADYKKKVIKAYCNVNSDCPEFSDDAKVAMVYGAVTGLAAGIHFDKFKAIIILLEGNKESETTTTEREGVGISHAITGTNLTHDFDLIELNRRVENVFHEFYGSKESGDNKKYCGPYFPFVQSSGMGKTKILWEYRKYCNNNKEKAPTAVTVLCRQMRDEKEKDVFGKFLDFDCIKTNDLNFNELVTSVFNKLDELLPKLITNRVVLMFDEAQYLLENGSYCSFDGEGKAQKKEMQALFFRLVRLWLCKSRESTQIVAIFTGTTAKLKNFVIEDDFEKQMKKTDTRDVSSSNNEYHKRGTDTFAPFFTTTTIGCLRKVRKGDKDDTEHFRAIPYGRPLFATMNKDEYNEFLPQAFGRMLLSKGDAWTDSKEVWLNILGTRVQMGQTSFEIASQLVGGSYANLVGLEPQRDSPKGDDASARIAYLADPVCARLAMCMMDPRFSLVPKGCEKEVWGEEKSWWVARLKDLHSGQVCTPEKGDLGEVMVALYLLFCADEIRGGQGGTYDTFSVPLSDWIGVLKAGGDKSGGNSEDVTGPMCKKTKTEQAEGQKDISNVTFSGIQVCRNYIRSYGDSWASILKQGFLENLHKSGVGFYVFEGCSVIDMVFALRLQTTEGQEDYVPLLISVKSHQYFSPSSAKKECERMIDKVNNGKDEVNNGKGKANNEMGSLGALCMLVILGAAANSKDENPLDQSCVDDLLDGKVVAQVLRIPVDDSFGISAAFDEMSSPETERSEVLASHGFMNLHCDDGINDDFLGKMVRCGHKQKDPLRQMVKQLAEDLENIESSPGR